MLWTNVAIVFIFKFLSIFPLFLGNIFTSTDTHKTFIVQFTGRGPLLTRKLAGQSHYTKSATHFGCNVVLRVRLSSVPSQQICIRTIQSCRCTISLHQSRSQSYTFTHSAWQRSIWSVHCSHLASRELHTCGHLPRYCSLTLVKISG